MGDSAAVPLVEPAAGGDDEPFLGMAWAEAIEATELLRSALAALDLAEEIPRLRGDVNVYGRPMVTVGRISPTAARRLAAALSRAAQQQPRVFGQPSRDACALPTATVPAPAAAPTMPPAMPPAMPTAMPTAVAAVAAVVPAAPAPRTAGGLAASPADSIRLPA